MEVILPKNLFMLIFLNFLDVFKETRRKNANLHLKFMILMKMGLSAMENYLRLRKFVYFFEIFAKVLKMMVGNNLNDIQLQQLVDRTIIKADEDFDGKISYDEFKKVKDFKSKTKIIYIKFFGMYRW